MNPNPSFRSEPKEFWANVRTISQQVGYTVRGKGQVKIPNLTEIKKAYKYLGLNLHRIVNEKDVLTKFGNDLLEYFRYRADVLNM